MRRIAFLLILIFLFGTIAYVHTDRVLGAGPDELQQAVEAKTKELEDVSKQIQETQGQINQLGTEKRSLNTDIKSLDYTVSQLNLSIRSSEINIEKLKLELELLHGKKIGTEETITSQKKAIAQVLREIQQKDGEDLFEILLKNETLADGVFEIQTLKDLQNNLSLNVAALTALHEELNQNIITTDSTKNNIEVENSNLKYRKEITGDKKEEKSTLLANTKNKESLYQKQLEELNTEQQAILDEISRIESELRAQFDPSAVPSARSGLLTWSVVLKQYGGKGIISQVYGETAYSRRFYKGKPHNGLDIAAPSGTPVYAADDGVVVHVDYNGLYYQYGRYVILQHANNLSTLYAHLSKYTVSNGQKVSRGELIGYVGNTGFTTGPHLHLGLYATPSGGWRQTTSAPGLLSISPAKGLVPVGVTFDPEKYL